MKKLTNIVGMATCAIAMAVAFGQANAQTQGQAFPSQADIAAKQRQVLDAMGKVSAPNSGQVRSQLNSNRASTNAVAGQDMSVLKSEATKSDFQRLARPGAMQGQAEKPKQAEDLMIFVSMSMPEQMLMNYASQAKRFNAVLMMRGFIDNKLSTTRQVLMRLNRAGARWEVSPEPFKHFKIDKVPAIVMASSESGSITEEGCARPETYTSIFGDMAVLDALDKIALRGQKPIAELAKARIMADRAAGRRGE